MSYLIEATKDLVIMNGSIVAPDRAFHLVDCNLTLKGVTVKAANRCIGAYNDCKITVDEDSVLETTGNDDVAVLLYSDAGRTDALTELEVNGTIKSNKYWCISGNGNANRGKTKITINEGAKVMSSGDSAIYHPQGGEITVKGGLVEGMDGIYMKAGKLTVEGGTIRGIGEKKNYIPSGNGTETPLGDGVVVEFAGYPAGMPKFVKNGGRIESKNGNVVGYYKPEKVVEELDTLKAENVEIIG